MCLLLIGIKLQKFENYFLKMGKYVNNQTEGEEK